MPWAVSRGTMSASAVSSARVTSSVFAPNWLEIVSSTPSRPCTSASPARSAAESSTLAKSPILSGTPLRTVTTAAASTAGSGAGTGDSISTRCASRSTKPAPRSASAARAASASSTSVIPYASSFGRSGLIVELPDVAAEHVHARDAGHREQLRLQAPVREVAQREAVELVGDEAELQHVHRARRERRQLRRADAFGQQARDAREPLGDVLVRALRIGAGLEVERNGGQARDRLRPQRRERLSAVHCGLDRPRHERLDLIGREARRLSLDRDLRGNELGKHVDWRLARLPKADRSGTRRRGS